MMNKDVREVAPQPIPDELKWIGRMTDLMDNSFRIPVLGIRFGLDPIIGLIPGIGDVITFSISGLLVLSMVRKGASAMLALKMIGNILFDAIIGEVPLIGDATDFFTKANRRNFKLMQEYYAEGKHSGNVWGVLFLVSIILLGILVGIVYLSWMVLESIITILSQ